MVLFPGVEYSGLQLVCLADQGDVLVLMSGAERFQRVVIPLVERSLHLVLSQLVHRVGESFQFVVADLVEPNILLELLESLLASHSLEHLDVLKDDLGHNQLGLPVILGVHVSSLAGDVSHAVIIGDGQLLQVS